MPIIRAGNTQVALDRHIYPIITNPFRRDLIKYERSYVGFRNFTSIILSAPLSHERLRPFLATYIVSVPSLYIEPYNLASFIDFT